MRRLFRSLAYNYSKGGIRLLFAKAINVLRNHLWSDIEWLVYERTLTLPPSESSFVTQHRRLAFDELEQLGYEKALAFPEDIRRRYARGDRCHGFFVAGQIVTLGWSSIDYMELTINERLHCPSAWGLFDFVTMPAFQSRGFYTDALRQLALLAHRDGFGSLWIAVHPANIPSRRGIERAGFLAARRIRERRLLGISRRTVRDP